MSTRVLISAPWIPKLDTSAPVCKVDEMDMAGQHVEGYIIGLSEDEKEGV
jgi:hypothetical protein